MKNIFLFIVAGLMLSNCGMIQDLNRRCGGFMDHMCEFIMGTDTEDLVDLEERVDQTEDRIDENEGRIDIHDDQLDQLEQEVIELRDSIDSNSQAIVDNEIEIENLEIMLLDLEASSDLADRALLNYVNSRVSRLRSAVRRNESAIRSALARLAELEQQIAITEIIDPCGDGSGVDEVLLVLDDSSVLAWYKNLGFAVLSNGSYVTTDRQRCRFSVDNGVVSYDND